MQFTIFAVAAIATFIGSLTDLQKREVADWINFSLIVFGIGSSALSSVVFWTIEPLVFSIAGFAVFFLLAWVMFRVGYWGGGDAKLLMAFGACFGLPLSLILPYVEIDGFMISFLSNFLISSAVYGLVWFIFLIVIKKEKFRRVLDETLREKKKRFFLGSAAGALLLAGSTVVPDLIATTFLAMIVAKAFFAVAGLFLLFFFCIIPASKAVQQLMMRRVSPYELTEGEVIAEEVFVENKVIASPADLGASKEQIQELQELHDQNKIQNVLIKVGIPLIPNFFVTMMMTYFFGNVLKIILENFSQVLTRL